MKVQFRRTKNVPCLKNPSKTATHLWNEVRGTVVGAKRDRSKCLCGGKKYVLVDDAVEQLRDRLGKRYHSPVYGKYVFCEHVVLKEIR